MKHFLYLIIFLIVGSSCEEVFEDAPQALVEASFLNSETLKAVSSNITVWGIGVETAWLKDTVLQRIILPLSPDDTTKYMISFDSQIDTVTFVHETFQKYDSMETGFYYEFRIKSIESTRNRIDFIEIIDSLVTKNWHENIQLYLRPLPAGSN